MEGTKGIKTVKKVAKKEPTVKAEESEPESMEDIEKAISKAMRSRARHFRDEADSLTLEGVRRVLEKDLGLDVFALDVHKKFVKQCLQEVFDGASDENASKNSGETVEEVVNPKKEETPDLFEELQLPKKEKEPTSEDEKEEEIRESPVEGLFSEETTPNDNDEAQSVKVEEALTEDTIKKAFKKRISYFKANSEALTPVGVRRLLEEDLKLDKNTLDPYKKFINLQLTELMQSFGDAEPANGAKNKHLKKGSPSKASRKVSSEESLEGEDEEIDEEEIKPKGKTATKRKSQNSEGLKSRKRPAKETTTSSNKKKRPVEPTSEESSDAKDGGNFSEDGHSQSSNEEPVKKKEISTQVYGKHVEHLKSVIKACGMSIPPNIYRRVKQAPESEREAALLKELEEILKREGLSTNPSEKEIKAVKRQKERTKELEGIDLSNIVPSSRRRSTYSFVPPPKPQIPDESSSEDNDNNNDNDNDDDDDDDDDNDSDDEEDAAESNSEAASEELNPDAEDDDSD